MKNRRAKVVYSYAPQNDDELKLEVDEIIEVLDEIEEGWWKGVTRSGITGVFPSNFVVEMTSDSPQTNKIDLSSSDNDLTTDSIDGSKSSALKENSETEKKPKPIPKVGLGNIFAGGFKPKLSPIDSSLDRNKANVPKKPPPPTPASDGESAPKLPPKPVREQAKVLFAYEAQNDDELTIKEGEIINIISKEIEDVGWWKGELNGRIALFPDNFVEIIKTEETVTPTRVKKPERPTEKPPPPVITTNPTNPSITAKLESNKSSNKSFEELPKTSIGSNSTGINSSSAPVIPGKKPKVLNSSILQSKPKSEPIQTPITSSVRPDVVPQENGSKLDKEIETNVKTNPTNISTISENHFTSIDSTGNKLTHLTAQRPKGPSSRRPPSTIFIPKESANDSKESNGDITLIKSEPIVNHSTEQIKTTPDIKPTPAEKVEKLPPWMVELRRAQEKRKENPDEPPKDNFRGSLNSPTKTSPNRFSGDFSGKNTPQTSTPEDNESNPKQLLKPLKLTKPNASNSIASIESPIIISNAISSNNITTKTTTNTTNIVISSATTATTTPTTNAVSSIKVSKVEETVNTPDKTPNKTPDKSENAIELEKQLRALKESTVSRKEFEELVKQVTELKELVETQKLSYSKIIKDLINDVADERKKLATLQIEIDRLRKLTTTV